MGLFGRLLPVCCPAILSGGAARHGLLNVAAAAGVGRATLYRYYPSREALLEALAAEALEEAGTRIADAGLDSAPAEEAIERIVRALVAVGDSYSVLVRERADATLRRSNASSPSRSAASSSAPATKVSSATTSPSTSSSPSSAA